MTSKNNGAEGQDFQAILDTMHKGNDLAVMAGNGAAIHPSSHFGNSVPMGGMGKTSILKEVNVRASASTEAKFPGQAPNPTAGLFKVVHGPLGTDGLPVHVRLESLGEWDIENLPAGMILSADARLPKGFDLHERTAFEREFPPHEYVVFSEEYSRYISTRSDAHFDQAAEMHTARWEVWQSRTATAKRQSAREEGSWKILHGAMQLQRNHHRSVADMLRLSLSQLNSLMIESVGMVRGVVGNCDDELADRIDEALVTSASVLKSSDAAAAMARVGVVLPEFAGQPENTVKRYEFDRFGDKKLSDTGQYVSAADFDKLAAQVIVQGKVPPADAILYHGQPGNVALLFPDQPAPSGFGWSVVRRWELRRSAYSFEAMTARMAVLEGLLARGEEIIKFYMGFEIKGPLHSQSEEFVKDYRAAQLPVDGVSIHD